MVTDIPGELWGIPKTTGPKLQTADPKPYEFLMFGDTGVTKRCYFISFGPRPREFIRFGAMDVTKPNEFSKVWGHWCDETL